MLRENVSMAVIRRMPRYYRYLDELYKNGVSRISSRALAESMGLTASQIRQDFNCFGGFGQQGYGYNVETLRSEIASIIGIDREYKAIIIGVGNIGHALLNNFDFAKRGFTLLAAFDISDAVVGTSVNSVTVRHLDEIEEFLRENPADVAVLTLPKRFAPQTAERLANLGIRGFWNFANIDLQLSKEGVKVENVHFSDSLMTLCYGITE